jgi:hypothetical protein
MSIEETYAKLTTKYSLVHSTVWKYFCSPRIHLKTAADEKALSFTFSFDNELLAASSFAAAAIILTNEILLNQSSYCYIYRSITIQVYSKSLMQELCPEQLLPKNSFYNGKTFQRSSGIRRGHRGYNSSGLFLYPTLHRGGIL